MGRPKNDQVWKHFRVVDSKSVQCNYCDQKYKNGNVCKMCSHLAKCFKCPEVIRKEMKQLTDDKKLKSDSIPKRIPMQIRSENVPLGLERLSTDLSRANHTAIETPSRNTNMTSEEDNIQPSTSFSSEGDHHHTMLSEKLAKAIIVSGAPLSLIEHPLWIEFLNFLQPSFKLPSRKMLTTRYLNQIYNDVKKEVKEELDTVNYMHLQLDGWTNINNEGVINFIISKPEPFFAESLNTEHNHKRIPP